jgi:hypothetical protein
MLLGEKEMILLPLGTRGVGLLVPSLLLAIVSFQAIELLNDALDCGSNRARA